MATIQKGKILRGDLNNWDGLTKTDTRIDATGGTITGVKLGDHVDVLMVYGSGTDYNSTTIDNAIAALGSNSASLLFATGNWEITENITIPSNLTALIPAGCVFNVSSGITLTFSGPVQRESDTWSSGSGTLIYSASNNVLAHTSDLVSNAAGRGASLVGIEDSTGLFTATEIEAALLELMSGKVGGDGAAKYRVVSCVLRQNTAGSGWDVIDDANHKPIGVSSVTETNGNINIIFDFTAIKIGSFIITPDEGYGSTELTMGASVGVTSATISLYHPFGARISGTTAAVQSYFGAEGGDWSLTTTTADGTYVFTHPAQTHSDSGGYPVTTGFHAEGANDAVGVKSVGKSGFTVQALNKLAGRVTTTPAVFTENAGTSSATWTGTDTLTITHPATSAADDAQVVANNPQYHAAITASGTTTITVQFFNIATGALYTGGSAPCGVKYMRGALIPSTIAGGLDAYVQRGPVKVDVTNVSGSTKNLWAFGIFEV